jgi:hypothetical protein
MKTEDRAFQNTLCFWSSSVFLRLQPFQPLGEPSTARIPPSTRRSPIRLSLGRPRQTVPPTRAAPPHRAVPPVQATIPVRIPARAIAAETEMATGTEIAAGTASHLATINRSQRATCPKVIRPACVCVGGSTHGEGRWPTQPPAFGPPISSEREAPFTDRQRAVTCHRFQVQFFLGQESSQHDNTARSHRLAYMR